MLTGLLGRSNATISINVPAHGLAVVLGFECQVAIEGAGNDAVIAYGPIAIQPQTNDVDDEGVTWLGRPYIERSGFGVAAEDAWDPFFVGSASINGGGVNGVTWRDG